MVAPLKRLMKEKAIIQMLECTHFGGEWGALDPNYEKQLEESLRGVAKNDERHLSDFYDLTRDRVYSLAMFITRDADMADDVVVEVYSQVWRQASGFDRSKGSILNWLLMITRSRTLDLIRSRNRHKSRETALDEAHELARPGHENPETEHLHLDRARLVRHALRELPHEQRELLLGGFFAGMTHSEMAQQFELPLGTVKSRIRLGLQSLKRALAPMERTWL